MVNAQTIDPPKVQQSQNPRPQPGCLCLPIELQINEAKTEFKLSANINVVQTNTRRLVYKEMNLTDTAGKKKPFWVDLQLRRLYFALSWVCEQPLQNSLWDPVNHLLCRHGNRSSPPPQKLFQSHASSALLELAYGNCSDSSHSLHLCERKDEFLQKTLRRKQIIQIVQQQPERNVRLQESVIQRRVCMQWVKLSTSSEL